MKKVLAVKLFFENSFPFLGKSQNEKKNADYGHARFFCKNSSVTAFRQKNNFLNVFQSEFSTGKRIFFSSKVFGLLSSNHVKNVTKC
jgi:hypothetical protein